ncbi:hypothetical protein C7271_11135, partial [filamentous cyanobacterium CCP5]
GLGDTDDLFESAVFSLQLDRQGIVADGALLAAPGHGFTMVSARTGASESVRLLPPETSLVATGHDLQSLGATTSGLLHRYGLSSGQLADVPSLMMAAFLKADQTERGQDWLATDYALARIEAAASRPDWALTVHRTPQTEPTLARLDQVAQEQGLSIGKLAIGEHDLVAWSRLSVADNSSRKRYPLQVRTEIAGLRTQLGDYEILSPSISLMDRLLRPEEGQKLIETSLWKTTTAPLSQPNTGYFYVNWPQVLPGLRQQFSWLRVVETAAQPLLSHLEAIAITGYESQSQIRTGALSLYLSNHQTQ